MTQDTLTQLLTDAANAHHAYEQLTGKPDANWQSWYSAYIIAALAASEPKPVSRDAERIASSLQDIYAGVI